MPCYANVNKLLPTELPPRYFFKFYIYTNLNVIFLSKLSPLKYSIWSYIFNRREISETVEPWLIVLVIPIILGIGCLIFCRYTFVRKRRTFRRRQGMGISIIIYFLKNEKARDRGRKNYFCLSINIWLMIINEMYLFLTLLFRRTCMYTKEMKI